MRSGGKRDSLAFLSKRETLWAFINTEGKRDHKSAFWREGNGYMSMTVKTPFGVLPDGRAVEQYTLRTGGLSCDILTYGGAIRALRVPDRNGSLVDVLLGFDTLEDYVRQDKYIGALVGRFANRIGSARFSLEGAEYPLAANNGLNHLHGGILGFDKQIWAVEEAGTGTLTLSLLSPDGQEGYPGNLRVRVTYTLTEEGLTLCYHAETDKTTLCNLTNHAYFNLSGHNSGPVTDQTIQILADAYTPSSPGSIPMGTVADVTGTPMDLRRPSAIGAQIDSPFPQLRQAGGYDHNWVLDGCGGAPRLFARAASAVTGITMEAATTLPGVQFYSGNFLEGCPAGKGGAPYGKRWGFCLETQFFPDSPNKPQFPSCVLHPGEAWEHTTAYRFKSV